MKLGYTLRNILTHSLQAFRDFNALLQQVIWILFDPSKFKRVNLEKIKNLLVIYAGATGDNYHVIGLLNAVKSKYPKINIFYLTMKNSQKFVKNPKINLIDLEEAKKLIINQKIDAAIMLNGATFHKELFDTDLRLRLLKVPYTSSYNEPNIRPDLFIKQFRPLFLTRRGFSFEKKGFEMQIEPFRLLKLDIIKPEFYYTKESEKNAIKFLSKNKISKKEKLIFMHPGAGTISKALSENKPASHQWPSKEWANLANKFLDKYNCRIIFTGSGEESKIIEEIIKGIKNKKKVIDTSNKLSIEDIASIMNKGNLLVTIDTSMAHIGAQTKIFVIDLFGPFPPRLAEPTTKHKKIIFHPEVCNSCRKYYCPEGNAICMKAIRVEEIFEASKNILK